MLGWQRSKQKCTRPNSTPNNTLVTKTVKAIIAYATVSQRHNDFLMLSETNSKRCKARHLSSRTSTPYKKEHEKRSRRVVRHHAAETVDLTSIELNHWLWKHEIRAARTDLLFLAGIKRSGTCQFGFWLGHWFLCTKKAITIAKIFAL